MNAGPVPSELATSQKFPILGKLRATFTQMGSTAEQSSAATKTGLIGLDFSRSAAHAVQLRRVHGSLATLADASVPLLQPREAILADPQALRPVLRRLFADNSFVGRKCVATLPNEHYRTLSVSYQVRQGASVDQAVLQALRERLSGDLANYVIDYIPVRTRQEENQRVAVAVVAQKQAVLALLDTLDRAGMDMAALEIGASAIRRMVCTLTADAGRSNVLLVNFGTYKSYLSIISGRRLLIDQEVELGEIHCIDDISRALGTDTDEARKTIERHGLLASDDVALTLQDILKPRLQEFVAHLRRLLMFARSETRGEPVDQVYLAGSIARWAGAAEMLDNLLSEPVSLIPDPIGRLQDLHPNQAVGMPQSQLAVATGLALRGLDDAP